MPYVITTTRLVAPDEYGTPFCAVCSHYHEDACLCPDCGRPTPCSHAGASVQTDATDVSRRAVTTLDKAVNLAIAACNAAGSVGLSVVDQVNDLSEDGGTVGPLPDGTVIAVERRLWSTLAVDDLGIEELRWDPPTADGDYLHDAQRDELEGLIDAYNAAQERS